MRILMLGLNQPGKGTFWRMWHLSRQMVLRGHTVTLIAASPRARLRGHTFASEGVTIVETPDLLWGPLRSGWDIWNSAYRIGWLRGRPFDVVHAFETRPVNLLPALAARRHGLAVCFDWCDWFGRGGSVEERPNPLIRGLLRPVETFFEERFRRQSVGTTVICSTLHERAVALGVRPETILLLRDGADVDGIRPLPIGDCRQRLRLPAKALIVGYVGSIFRRDAQLMAEAFNRIQARNRQARLLLIGYLNADVESLVAVPQAIIRTGPIIYEQLAGYLSACDLGWLPYCDSGANRGRYPLKLNDYLAAGLPVVATAVGDVTPILQSDPIGLLTPPDPTALADAVLQLAAQPDRRRALGATARLIAKRDFDWRMRAERLETFYHRVLDA